MDFNTPLQYIKGIGEARSKCFSKLGLSCAGDLLTFYPRTYEYRGETKKIADVCDGEVCSLILTVDSPVKTGGGKVQYIKFTAGDDTGTVNITFFNQKWLLKVFSQGRAFRFYGKVSFGFYGKEMVSPEVEPILHGKKLCDVVPIYPLTKGLSQKTVTSAVNNVLALADSVKDVLPEEIRKKYALLKAGEAIKMLHHPADRSEVAKAKRTLAFEELVVFQTALRISRRGKVKSTGIKMSFKNSGVKQFFESLPFSLTGAQEKSVKEILGDMCGDTPMTRLLQGDVGSGKTAVAAAAVYFAVKNGYQCAFMAPTEILASQHAKTLDKMLSPFGIKVGLLTGGLTKKQRTLLQARLSEGAIDVAVGTNALIQNSVEYHNLGLVITDEQHRFGVMQRARLTEKGGSGSVKPHMLVMSATPIPRTLSLILYGDLDISVLDELPPGRQKVDTYLVGSDKRERVFKMIRSRIEAGNQAYIICPLVEENEESDKQSAEGYAEAMRRGSFSDINIGMLHGKMTPSEKEEIMRSFSKGDTKILVSTTVVEVGVDVPNATVILIENAECFGLSQLHQLRGRVGRGKDKSMCVLMSDHAYGKTENRLKIMCETNDGFAIAAADLDQRGPGDFFGEKQSGVLAFKVASAADMNMLEAAKKLSEELFDKGLESYPVLYQKASVIASGNERGNKIS
ncbi:MAG: ATP-dependent DNA helicase RecG [Clostridia bacterium]|nr:ATP-dependent DNA helicase RecG [Clostridia bacterium]